MAPCYSRQAKSRACEHTEHTDRGSHCFGSKAESGRKLAVGGMPETGCGSQVAAVEQKDTILVCVGDEWHRYPSSFFLPSPSYRLAFVKSGFGGLLPRAFSFQDVPSTPTPPPHLVHHFL